MQIHKILTLKHHYVNVDPVSFPNRFTSIEWCEFIRLVNKISAKILKPFRHKVTPESSGHQCMRVLCWNTCQEKQENPFQFDILHCVMSKGLKELQYKSEIPHWAFGGVVDKCFAPFSDKFMCPPQGTIHGAVTDCNSCYLLNLNNSLSKGTFPCLEVLVGRLVHTICGSDFITTSSVWWANP